MLSLTDIPVEVMTFHMAKYLHLQDLAAMAASCKALRDWLENDKLAWRRAAANSNRAAAISSFFHHMVPEPSSSSTWSKGATKAVKQWSQGVLAADALWPQGRIVVISTGAREPRRWGAGPDFGDSPMFSHFAGSGVPPELCETYRNVYGSFGVSYESAGRPFHNEYSPPWPLRGCLAQQGAVDELIKIARSDPLHPICDALASGTAPAGHHKALISNPMGLMCAWDSSAFGMSTSDACLGMVGQIGSGDLVACVKVAPRSMRNKYGFGIQKSITVHTTAVTKEYAWIIGGSYSQAIAIPYGESPFPDPDGEPTYSGIKLAATTPVAVAQSDTHLFVAFSNGSVQALDTDPESPTFILKAEARKRPSRSVVPNIHPAKLPIDSIAVLDDTVYTLAPNHGVVATPLAVFPFLASTGEAMASAGKSKPKMKKVIDASSISFLATRATPGLGVTPRHILVGDAALRSIRVFDRVSGTPVARVPLPVPELTSLVVSATCETIIAFHADRTSYTRIAVSASAQPSAQSEEEAGGPSSAGSRKRPREEEEEEEEEESGGRSSRSRSRRTRRRGLPSAPRALDDVIVCLSSVRERKSALTAAIVEAGGRVSERVSNGISYLVSDTTSQYRTKKGIRADDLGIPIISSDELRNMIARFDPKS